jgi:hypothetical protein
MSHNGTCPPPPSHPRLAGYAVGMSRWPAGYLKLGSSSSAQRVRCGRNRDARAVPASPSSSPQVSPK